MILYGIGILIILLGGTAQLFADAGKKGRIVALFTAIGSSVLAVPVLKTLMTASVPETSFTLPQPIGTISFLLDPLAAFFALTIAVSGTIGILYGSGYLAKTDNSIKDDAAEHWAMLPLFLASMLGLVTAAHTIVFLFFWEMMSLSSLMLLVHDREKEEVRDAAVNYFIAMHIAFVLLAIAFMTTAIKADSYLFSQLAAYLTSNKTEAFFVFFIFFAGFGLKAGFMPLHSWLPKAHPAAPSHVSGMMSGIMIKTGIYGILRLLCMIGTPSIEMGLIVLAVGIVSAVCGIFYAAIQDDIKKMLAYSSIENIGIIGIGIGAGMIGLASGNNLLASLAFLGTLLHTFNHALFKPLLFFGAGAVYKITHTRHMEQLGGLAKLMPHTAGLFAIGAIAISGLPPLNGFISEFVLYSGLFSALRSNSITLSIALIIAAAALSLAGAVAILAFTRLFGIVFQGHPRSEHTQHATDPVLPMRSAMWLLAVLCLLIGLFPYIILPVVTPAAALLAHSSDNSAIAGYLSALYYASAASAALIILALLLYAIRTMLLKGRSVTAAPTWGCGYSSPNTRMQYSAYSFSAPFLALIRRIITVNIAIKKPHGIFPTVARFEAHPRDVIDRHIIHPMLFAVRRVLNLFRWIQSGDTGQYILYGIIFMIASLVWIMRS